MCRQEKQSATLPDKAVGDLEKKKLLQNLLFRMSQTKTTKIKRNKEIQYLRFDAAHARAPSCNNKGSMFAADLDCHDLCINLYLLTRYNDRN